MLGFIVFAFTIAFQHFETVDLCISNILATSTDFIPFLTIDKMLSFVVSDRSALRLPMFTICPSYLALQKIHLFPVYILLIDGGEFYKVQYFERFNAPLRCLELSFIRKCFPISTPLQKS